MMPVTVSVSPTKPNSIHIQKLAFYDTNPKNRSVVLECVIEVPQIGPHPFVQYAC